jgi:hypothetical protein
MRPSTQFALFLVAVALAVVLAVQGQAIGWWQVGGGWSRSANGVALVSSTTPVTGGRYDSLESPRGTDYQVPAGQTLYITNWIGTPQMASGSSFTLEIGYGDTAVNNSVAAPTTPIVVYAVSWRTADGPPVNRSTWIEVPAGKYPFVRPVDGDAVVFVTGTAE